ncbi:RpiR family transcriptional regulator [Rhodoglobus vestalii]|uniref:RpiR family transcriptional regulator n=1 Tax=Rhodoglobus vestalii TaxID=193384 RepID=A0A8H2K8S1_9MICO|nr:MurR/RpiR family transcriptional regulator [Rhodoglobus vestalii]TQO18811.1 RpiR family transcriptional regulator [Rhodoglobus vestalii]
MTSEEHVSVTEKIRRGMGDCTPAERKVARVLLASSPSAGFETVAKLAARAGVSGPTVVRFAVRFGFTGFPEFQQALRDDLDQRSASPMAIYDRDLSTAGPRSAEGASVLDRAAETTSRAIAGTFAEVAPHDFEAGVAAIAGARGQVWLAGGRFGGLFARYLAQHLQMLRAGVTLLPEEPSARAAAMTGIGRTDVLVLFDYRRYEEGTRALATRAAKRHTPVVLFTDSWISPIALDATVVLASQTDSPSPFDAMSPVLALVEAVIAGCLESLGNPAAERMRRTEATAEELGLY